MGRIISTEADIEELNSEYSLRPKYLDEYIGQNKVKENLKIFIEAAKRNNVCRFHSPDGHTASFAKNGRFLVRPPKEALS